MADTFDSRLKLRLQESGGNSGQWGDLLNQTITNVASVFGFGTHQLTADSDATLTLADDGASLDALKSSYLKITSSVSLTATRVLTFSPNTFNQVKYIENATTGSQSITISQGSGANVTIATGKTAVVYFDGAGSGAAVVDALAGVDPGVTDTLTEVLAAGNATGGTDIAVGTGDDITFADNSKAIFGAGSDLQIFHDGSNSFITDAGTGSLFIRTSVKTQLQNADGTENYAIFNENGAVNLYHDNSEKFATTSTGIDVTGGLNATAKTTLSLGSSDGTSLELKNTSNVHGSQLTFFNDSSTPADDDRLGQILFNGDDSAGNETTYVRVRAESSDVTDGSEDGKLQMSVVSGGSLVTPLQVGIDGVVVNEFSTAAQDFRVESDGNTHMIFVDAGNDHVNIGTSSDFGGVLNVNGGAVFDDATTLDPDTMGTGRLGLGQIADGSGFASPGLGFGGTGGNTAAIVNASGTLFFGLGDKSNANSLKSMIVASQTEISFNEDSLDADFRVESDSNSHMLFVDAGNNTVGIGAASAAAPLEVTGAFGYASGANSLATTVSKAAARIRGSSDATTSLFFGSLTNDAEQYIQSSNGAGTGADDIVLNPYGGNVGIGGTPSTTLDVNGSASVNGQASFGNTSTNDTIVLNGQQDGTVIQFKAGGTHRFDLDCNATGTDNLSFNNIDATKLFTIYRSSEVVVNEDSTSTVDFRVESDNNSSMFFINAGNDSVEITKAQSGAAALTVSNNSSNGSDVEAIVTSMTSDSNNTNCFHLKSITQGIASYGLRGDGSSTFTSDERLKTDIVNVEDGHLEKLNAVRIVNFKWKADPNGPAQMGVIAQEMEDIFPDLVVDDKDAIGTGETYKSVSYSKLNTIALKAIQELSAKVEALEAELAKLKGE